MKTFLSNTESRMAAVPPEFLSNRITILETLPKEAINSGVSVGNIVYSMSSSINKIEENWECYIPS